MDLSSRAAEALPDGCEFLDAFVFDVNGIARGKRLPASAWPGLLREGITFSASALILDATGASRGPLGLGAEDGDPDAIAMPLPGTPMPVPWRVGLAQVQLGMAGQWFDPRRVLEDVVAICRADGLHPVVACELEFYLIVPDAQGRPVPPRLRNGDIAGSAGHLCVQRIEDHGEFLHALHAALAAQGIAAGALVSEYGPGQFEVNLPHLADPLLAADQAALLRRATLGVAAARGARASFMAKPYADQPGSGLHMHLSFVDETGRNRFAADGGEALLRRAIAGMRALHRESMAFFAPSFSAYRRYRPGAFVALDGAWGENRRDVAFRIPAGAGAARRVEHRVAGADASPHLAMAAVLAAAHHGIAQSLAVDADAPPPPRDIFAALGAMSGARVLPRYVGADFLRLFVALKQAEAAALLDAVTDPEYRFYL